MPKVSANVKVDARKIDDVIAGVDWISRVPFAKKAFALSKIKEKLLTKLRLIFPVSTRTRRENRPHLLTGFRAYEYEKGDKVGLVIQHRGIKDLRIRAILFSLESGSRGYYQRPEHTSAHGFGLFTIRPGKGMGNSTDPITDFAMRKRIHIPARPGIGFMKQTLAYARELMREAKPEFFKQAKAAVKKGAR